MGDRSGGSKACVVLRCEARAGYVWGGYNTATCIEMKERLVWEAGRVAMKHSEAGRREAGGAVRGQSHREKQRRAGAALLPGRQQAQRRGGRQAGGWRSACSLLRKVRKQGKSGMASMGWIGWGRSAAAPPPACRSAAGGRDSSWRRQRGPLGVGSAAQRSAFRRARAVGNTADCFIGTAGQAACWSVLCLRSRVGLSNAAAGCRSRQLSSRATSHRNRGSKRPRGAARRRRGPAGGAAGREWQQRWARGRAGHGQR